MKASHFLNHPDPTVRAVAGAYAEGAFLMDNGDGPQFYGTDERAILHMTEEDGLHVPRRLSRQLKQFECTTNQLYDVVIEGCRGTLEGSKPREDGEWISPELAALYLHLHRAGLAHSFEVWQDGQLAGGVMGIALGGVFFAESKFHLRPNASKAAVVLLGRHLKVRGFALYDVQLANEHTAQFGLQLLNEDEFAARMASALPIDAEF